MRSALRFISYFRAMEEIIAQIRAFNLDRKAVLCHRSLHTVVQGTENTMASTEDRAPMGAVPEVEEDAQGRTFAVGSDEGEAFGD